MAKFKCKICGFVTEEYEELPEDYKCPMCGASAAFVCKVCGYVHEADELPEDFTCPMCGVPASNFEEQ